MITVRSISTKEIFFTFKSWSDFNFAFPNGIPTEGKILFEVVEV